VHLSQNEDGSPKIVIRYANLFTHKMLQKDYGALAGEDVKNLGNCDFFSSWANNYLKSREEGTSNNRLLFTKIGKPIYVEGTWTGHNRSIEFEYWGCVSHFQDDLYIFIVQDVGGVKVKSFPGLSLIFRNWKKN
jgi:hypothetical protein